MRAWVQNSPKGYPQQYKISEEDFWVEQIKPFDFKNQDENISSNCWSKVNKMDVIWLHQRFILQNKWNVYIEIFNC